MTSRTSIEHLERRVLLASDRIPIQVIDGARVLQRLLRLLRLLEFGVIKIATIGIAFAATCNRWNSKSSARTIIRCGKPFERE